MLNGDRHAHMAASEEMLRPPVHAATNCDYGRNTRSTYSAGQMRYSTPGTATVDKRFLNHAEA